MIYSSCVAGGSFLPSPPLIWWHWCHYLAARRSAGISLLPYTLSQTSFYSKRRKKEKEGSHNVKNTSNTIQYNLFIIMSPFSSIFYKSLEKIKLKKMWMKGKVWKREKSQTGREIVYFLPAHLGYISSEGNTVNNWDITVQSLGSHY